MSETYEERAFNAENELDKLRPELVLAKRQNMQLRERLEALEAWLEGDCNCPCCQQTRVCVDDCTFAHDDPNAAKRMAAVRSVLYGPDNDGGDISARRRGFELGSSGEHPLHHEKDPTLRLAETQLNHYRRGGNRKAR